LGKIVHKIEFFKTNNSVASLQRPATIFNRFSGKLLPYLALNQSRKNSFSNNYFVLFPVKKAPRSVSF
jgi:hypothetical protein